MRNLEEPRELFKRYFELRRATRFLSAGQLKESSDYRSLLQVESKLKDLTFTGEQIMQMEDYFERAFRKRD
ncbi:hypothetical protein J4422_03920 [Candidatus Pacearchaeota archaeon]|nr:hypothetical protein [Candidatus Pacearchaeota archaeon]